MSRKFKKLAALLLVAMMTLAMSLSVFAAEQTKCVDQDTIDKVVFDTKYILDNKIVKIDCINEKVNHPDVTYWGAIGGFYVSPIKGNPNSGYTCDVTVTPEVYVAQYNRQIGVKHVLEPSTQGAQTITFAFNMKRGIWELQSKLPVVYTVICDCDTETEAPETEAPETEVPETEAPETDAPETEVPETEAPETEVEEETEAPETEVEEETEAPETDAPETEAPETDAPETEVPETEVEDDTDVEDETEVETDAEEETEKEVVVPSEDGSKPGPGTTVEKVDTPDTGDMAPAGYFVTIMAICMALAGAVQFVTKRQR